MKKRFKYLNGDLVVEKVTMDKKPAIRVSMDSVKVEFGYDYEHARDRAFDGFDQRNADTAYRGMMELGEQL